MHKALRECLVLMFSSEALWSTEKEQRFDFVHNGPMTEEQIFQVEDIVNKEILKTPRQ